MHFLLSSWWGNSFSIPLALGWSFLSTPIIRSQVYQSSFTTERNGEMGPLQLWLQRRQNQEEWNCQCSENFTIRIRGCDTKRWLWGTEDMLCGRYRTSGTRQGLSQTGQTLVSLSHLHIRDFTHSPKRRGWELMAKWDGGILHLEMRKLRFRKVKQLIRINQILRRKQAPHKWCGQHGSLEHPFGNQYSCSDSTNVCWGLARY